MPQNASNEYITAKRITSKYDVCSGTLRRWANDGKIKCIRPDTITGSRGGKRLYYVPDIEKMFGVQSVTDNQITVCYARVSSSHQKEDLQRQIQVLQTAYPNSKIIEDIGSGINWKRPGCRALLELIHQGKVKSVVVTYKDRMCRFGFELLDWIFIKHNIEFVVLNRGHDVKDAARELSDDLLAITTVFVAKNNGLRSATYRKNKADANQIGSHFESETLSETPT